MNASELKQTLVARACSYELANAIGDEIDRLRVELAEARRLLDEARKQEPDVFVCHKPNTGYKTIVMSQTAAQIYRNEGYSVIGYYAATVPAQPEYLVHDICNAYESGVGHAGRPTAKVNPYPPGTPQHTAYEIGANGAKHNAQPAIPAEVGRAVQILRKHNEWRRGADNNHWQATPYSPAELGRAIDTVCDHVSHSAQPDVLRRATEYAHDIVTWLHRDHYADNTTFEPFGDLLGLLSQIDNMICGWKEPTQPTVPDDVAKDAARYRWMRADGPNTYMTLKETAHLIGDAYDAAIDAAILSATDSEGRKDE